jgi:S-methylmethionine-dependent homocysteine/selenocysteine methylase
MKSVSLLDGGLGQEIYRRAPSVSSPLWSVAVMQAHPDRGGETEAIQNLNSAFSVMKAHFQE